MAHLTRDGSDLIKKTVQETHQIAPDHKDLVETFEIHQTVSWITSNDFKNIGLQFPNELLPVAVPICQLLTSCLKGQNCLILGDSTFAGCCVDEIIGQRASIDAIVHYGRACLSKTVGRLPVFYVFGKMTSIFDEDSEKVQTVVDNLLSCLDMSQQSQSALPLVMTYDFRYRDSAKMLCDKLRQLQCFKHIYWSEPNVPRDLVSSPNPESGQIDHPRQVTRCGRIIYTLESDTTNTDDLSSSSTTPWALVHLSSGHDSNPDAFTFYRILLSLPEVERSKAFVLDCSTGQLKSYDSALRVLLKRRSHLIERVKDAQRFGILIGTLSVDNYSNILERLKRLLKLGGRSYITLFVGRLNEAKLANLTELDVLVCVACPETSLIDSRDLFIPVVTPFEVECALGSLYANDSTVNANTRQWTGTNFWLDFRDLLPGGHAYVTEDSIVPNITEALGDVSLITGQTRIAKPLCESGDSNSNMALVEQEPWNLATTASGQGKSYRTWFGLDPQIGQTPVSQIKEGRQGIPTSYSHEPDTN